MYTATTYTVKNDQNTHDYMYTYQNLNEWKCILNNKMKPMECNYINYQNIPIDKDLYGIVDIKLVFGDRYVSILQYNKWFGLYVNIIYSMVFDDRIWKHYMQTLIISQNRHGDISKYFCHYNKNYNINWYLLMYTF